jgi:hypothetical protein
VIADKRAQLPRTMLWRHPCNAQIYGNTQAGKSTLALDIIRNAKRVYGVDFDEIIYIYTAWNDAFDDFPQVTFVREFPVLDKKQKTLLVCDDVILNDDLIKSLLDVFVISGHHTSTSVLLLCQELNFHKRSRAISLNTHVFILFKNNRDMHSIKSLFRQISMPYKMLSDAFRKATTESYKYLCINLQNNIPDELRLTSDITSRHPTIYIDAQLKTPYQINGVGLSKS